MSDLPLGRSGHLQPSFFARPAEVVAPDLIGVTLLVDGVGGRIVEVEAYDQSEPASHGFRGPTTRTASLFGPPGRAYVYRSYGLHWCLNLVCGQEGRAAAVLVRALEPTRGLEQIRARRGRDDLYQLCAGPGRVAQALGLTGADDGRGLHSPPFELLPRGTARTDVAATPRIGITRATELPWRFIEAHSRFVSGPRSRPAVRPETRC
jgi:DNA-3-methyladenine glycosylase